MARPFSEGLEFFSIKTNGDKLETALTDKFGNNGFGVYYRTLRLLAQSMNGELDCANKILMESYAKSTGVSLQLWKSIVDCSANIGLFDAKLWQSKKLLVSKNMNEQLARVHKERESARFRQWRRLNPDADPNEFNSANNHESPADSNKNKNIHSNRDRNNESEKPSKSGSAFKGKKIGEIVESINL